MYSQGIIAGWYYIGCTVLSLSLFFLSSRSPSVSRFSFQSRNAEFRESNGTRVIHRSAWRIVYESRGYFSWFPVSWPGFRISGPSPGFRRDECCADSISCRLLVVFYFFSMYFVPFKRVQIRISSNVSLLRFSSSLWNDFWLKLIIYRVTLWNLGLEWIWGKNIWEWNWYSLRK